MKKILSLMVMLMFVGAVAFGQQISVSGKVVRENGESVPFASVTLKGAKAGVTADENGAFTIKAKKGDVLTISSLGSSSDVEVKGASLGEISLSKKTVKDEEVTVVATGIGGIRQAAQLGVSTAKVKATELTQAKVINLQNGLTGKVSGLNVQTVNNGVFADTRITLRSIRSLTGNNQPMLILDGMPISLGFINSINPNDIAEVNILKSSSSTAIYGPEGVNGAIVITLKKGSKNKPTITVSNTLQIEKVTFLPKFQNQFGSGSSVDAFGYGVYDPVENQGYGDAFDGSLRQIGRPNAAGDIQQYTYEARPDEKLKFWNTGVTNQSDVSYSTGDFYLSAQNVSIKGIVPKDQNNRISATMRANKEYNKFKASFGVTYTQQKYDVNAGSSFGNGRDFNPYWNLINTPAQIPVTKFKDWKNDYWSSPNGYYNDYYHNPYWAIDNFRNNGRSDDLLGNIQLDYRVNSWLSLTTRTGYTHSTGNSKARQYQTVFSNFAINSGKSNAQSNFAASVQDFANFSNRLTIETFAKFNRNLTDNIKFDAILGHSFREINTNNIGIVANLGIPAVFNPSARLGEVDPSQSFSQQKLQRFFGRVGFGYKEFLFLEATGSYDRDSRLSNPFNYNTKDISFFYPGVNASLVLTEAIPSLKNTSISFAKVRGAISKTGNVNIGTYSLQNTYGLATDFPYGSLLGYTANNTIRRSSYEPEFVVNNEIGIELGFLKNKINFEATAYSQDNTNQIITAQYSATTGFPAALLNAASFTNKGLELDLKLTPLIQVSNDLKIDFKVNYTRQQNKVNSLIDGVDELGIGNNNFIIKGESAYVFKLTDYVRDSEGRIIVDANTGLPTVDPVLKKFGQTIPKDLLGLNINVSYKNFGLSAVADYRGGNQILSSIGSDLDFAGLSLRTGQNSRQPFVLPNSSYFDGTKYVPNTNVFIGNAYNFWSTAVNTNAQTNYLSSAAFWKLREVALTYNFPTKMFTNKGIKGASVSVSGRNILAWFPKTNEWTDSEFSSTTGNAQGVNSRNNTPPTRIMGLNFTLNF
jgi:TonB-linked SusC/RagA family outer membrane protein